MVCETPPPGGLRISLQSVERNYTQCRSSFSEGARIQRWVYQFLSRRLLFNWFSRQRKFQIKICHKIIIPEGLKNNWYPKIVDNVDDLDYVWIEEEDEVLLHQPHVTSVLPVQQKTVAIYPPFHFKFYILYYNEVQSYKQLVRVSSKQTKKIFSSNRNKPKLNLFRFIFGLFRETNK
jgi:hypothetical protein